MSDIKRARRRALCCCAVGVWLMSASITQHALAGGSDSQVKSISSGEANSITAGGAHSITAGGTRSITAGGAHSITAGGTDSITAGGTDSITAGGAHSITAGGIYNFQSGGAQSITAGGHHVLTGPVDSIDRNNGTFSSLGQTVFAGNDMLGNLAIGDYIAVYGTVSGPGFLYADAVGRIPHRYVDGASEVFIVGLPTSIDVSTASAEIGGIRVEYGASLSMSDHPRSDIVGFRGIRPNAGGSLITVAD